MDVSPSWKKTLILLITVLAPFTATLDASIVNVALPVLSRSLHTESSSVAWVSNIYTIVMAAAILFFGRLGDIRGQEKVFTGGMALFAAGSLLCSFASGFGELLAAGGSAALANSQGIIVRTFPASQRGRALGLNGAFVALGMAAGPSAGGWLLAYGSWPFIFLIKGHFLICLFSHSVFLFSPVSREFQGGVPFRFRSADSIPVLVFPVYQGTAEVLLSPASSFSVSEPDFFHQHLLRFFFFFSYRLLYAGTAFLSGKHPGSFSRSGRTLSGLLRCGADRILSSRRLARRPVGRRKNNFAGAVSDRFGTPFVNYFIPEFSSDSHDRGFICHGAGNRAVSAS